MSDRSRNRPQYNTLVIRALRSRPRHAYESSDVFTGFGPIFAVLGHILFKTTLPGKQVGGARQPSLDDFQVLTKIELKFNQEFMRYNW